MRVLIACEFSGIVREAFAKRGHDAYSCDLLPSEIPSDHHFQTDIFKLFTMPIGVEWFDLIIAHPPCTHLAVSGARWFKDKATEQKDAIKFFMDLINLPVSRIAVENPVSIMSTVYRKPDQIIQPWMFGHPETKATCLWLKNLPLLKPTNMVMPMFHSCHKESPSPDRWKNRSRTFKGFAEAMATQWGNL